MGRIGFAFLAAGLVAACGGASFTAGPGMSGDDASTDASGAETGSGAEGGGGSGDSGPSMGEAGSSEAGATSEAGSGSGEAGVIEAGAPCPDVSGPYAVTTVDATGCLGLATTLSQCIKQSSCTVEFASSGGSGTGIEGSATLQADGSFSNASLKEGTQSRTGCTGTWAPGQSTMTVDCGGMATAQSCVVLLTRKSGVCN
jgi:hypothetical protein